MPVIGEMSTEVLFRKSNISGTAVDCILFIRRPDTAKGTSSCLRPTYDANRVTKGGGRTAAQNENRNYPLRFPWAGRPSFSAPPEA